MTRRFLIFIFIGLGLLTVGCVPLPTESVVHYGVKARLIDAESGMPVAKRHGTVTVDDRSFKRKTNRNGELTIAPESHHYFTWLGGPIWMNPTKATIDIAFEGYLPYHRVFVVRTEGPDAPPPADKERLCGSFVVLGDLKIQKTGNTVR